MGTVEFQTRHTFDRRIGRRVDLEPPVDATWVIASTGRFGAKKRPLEVPGRILNLSITGAAVTGPPDLPLEAGATAHLRCDGRDSVVVVRHVAHLGDGTARYGVEITRPHPSLARRINEVLADAPRVAPTPVAPEMPLAPTAPEPLVADSVQPAQAEPLVAEAAQTVQAEPAVADPVLDLTGDEPVIDLTDP